MRSFFHFVLLGFDALRFVLAFLRFEAKLGLAPFCSEFYEVMEAFVVGAAVSSFVAEVE